MSKKNKIKVLEIASSILKSESKLDLELVDIKSKLKLEDYTQEDMMKLLLTKIKGACYNSKCLVDKVKQI